MLNNPTNFGHHHYLIFLVGGAPPQTLNSKLTKKSLFWHMLHTKLTDLYLISLRTPYLKNRRDFVKWKVKNENGRFHVDQYNYEL